TFQGLLKGVADLAFFPTGTADLHYLVGIPREFPNYGATIHPGMWMEGAWLTPHHAPVVTVPRMTAEFGGLHASDAEFKIIGDADDPRTILQAVLRGFDLPARPRIALSDRAHAETVVHLQNLLPDAQFISA